MEHYSVPGHRESARVAAPQKVRALRGPGLASALIAEDAPLHDPTSAYAQKHLSQVRCSTHLRNTLDCKAGLSLVSSVRCSLDPSLFCLLTIPQD